MKGLITAPSGLKGNPTAPGRRAAGYDVCPLFKYCFIIEKYPDIFRGGGLGTDFLGGFSFWGGGFCVNFPGEILHEGNIARINIRTYFPGEILHEGKIARIHVRNYFYSSYFLFGDSILHVKDALQEISMGNF